MRKLRDFIVYFFNLKGNLLEVDLDINLEIRKCEDCRNRFFGIRDVVYDVILCLEIDLRL